MKKIGILTILKVNNYGAELQAYATQTAMNKMGYNAEIIDYLYYRNSMHIKEKCSLPFYPYPFKNRIKEWGLSLKDKLLNIVYREENRRRKELFDTFNKTFNRFSYRQYRKFSDLYNNPPFYDVYCVGSDQVWNPRCYTNLYPYFLTFSNKNAVRFSYASSFGVSTLPNNVIKQYTKCLKGLSYISVRESTGCDIVNNLTGRKAQLVADPTLLLAPKDWEKVEKRVNGIPDKYVLVYELHPIPRIMELAHLVAQKLGAKVVRLCKDVASRKKENGVMNIVEAGPSEFVYLFHHATFIVTNSFHGTAFSINFRKDFYCVLSKRQNNNGRQQSLLSLCNLNDRINFVEEKIPDFEALHINYTFTEKSLANFVEQSKQYIRRAIDGE